MESNLRSAILFYAIKYDGDWNKIGKAIQNKEYYRSMDYPYPFITVADENYPDAFRKLRYPPWIFFYQGNINLLNKECIGIVGSRKCSNQALNNTQKVVNEIKEKYCIVSGLAKGIDAMAHWSSIDQCTIGIIGCGIDKIYPKENDSLYKIMKKDHLIISEYPMGVRPLAYHFPWRNRLIAACSKALIVIEATIKSGTMLTVNECVELSVPVYCLPTAFENKDYLGCNYLISNGAMLLLSEKELKDI